MRTGWKITLGIAGTATVIGGAVGLFFFGMQWKFNPEPPAIKYSRQATALEAQRQDLDYFGKLIALDHAFTPAARAEANRRLATLEGGNVALDRGHFRVALMEIVALANNGHTRLNASQDQMEPELPVRAAKFSDGIYVMRVKNKDADILGTRVEAIDGLPIDKVLARLMPLRGGTDNFKHWDIIQLLYQQDLMFGAGLTPDMHSSIWALRKPSGETVERRFVTYVPSKDETPKRGTRWYSPEPLKGMDKGWARLVPVSGTTPVSFEDFDKTFRRIRLPDSCVSYVQLKAITDTGSEKIQPFLKEVEADFAAQRPCAAIIDLRFNTGGDYTNGYSFAKQLPDLVKGPIYVLTSPQTFSAAITTTAFIKQAAPERVHILGEMVGDRMPFYAEGNRGCLPNYHLCIGYQTGMHDYLHPCTDLNECYWLNYLYPVRIKTFEPEETIRMTFAEWSAGHDPVFERAVELAEGPQLMKHNAGNGRSDAAGDAAR